MGLVAGLPCRKAHLPVTLIWTVLIGVSAYRLWRLVAEDSITEPLRVRYLPGRVEEFIYCGWCLGSWIAFGLTWATDLYVGLDAPVLAGLAAAAVVGWLSELS